MLEHADTCDLVEDRFPFKVSVIPQLDRYPILKTGERDALVCDFQLLLTERDTMGLDTVMLCRVNDQRAPSATDVQKAVPRPEQELAAYVVELGLLGLLQIVIWLLKPQGLFLNHGITHDVEGWSKTTSTEFINRYVFPDGQLDTVSNIQRGMEHARFEITDVEGLRPHYALTLRRWVSRLEQHHEQALQYVSESTYRVWRLYMAASALEFESGEIGIYQVVASKRAVGSKLPPLTRRHMYPPRWLAPC